MYCSSEQALHEFTKSLEEYKESVEKLCLNTSDKKKLLALPFYMSKRMQLPEPRPGQPEYNLFKKLTGKDWYAFAGMSID